MELSQDHDTQQPQLEMYAAGTARGRTDCAKALPAQYALPCPFTPIQTRQEPHMTVRNSSLKNITSSTSLMRCYLAQQQNPDPKTSKGSNAESSLPPPVTYIKPLPSFCSALPSFLGTPSCPTLIQITSAKPHNSFTGRLG